MLDVLRYVTVYHQEHVMSTQGYVTLVVQQAGLASTVRVSKKEIPIIVSFLKSCSFLFIQIINL